MSRIEKALHQVRDIHCDTLFITQPENITYLTNFTGDSSHLLLSGQGCVLLTDGRYTEQAKSECRQEVEIFSWIDNKRYGIETYRHVLKTLKSKRIAFESDVLSFADHKKLETGLSEFTLVPTENRIEQLRLVKDEQEVSCLREACRISDKALELTIPAIKPQMTEMEITSLLEYNLKTQGAEDISFTSIVLSGSKTSLLHGKPGSRQVEKGDFILFDFGALYKGYHADISRTIVLGKASKKQRLLYSIIREAQQKAVDCLVPGLAGNKPDEIVRNTIPDEFIGYYYPGLGHGVGLQIHELPFIKKESDFIFQKGMVVTIEPGIYIPGWGGLRIEDTVLIDENGNASLTRFSRDLIEII